MEIPATLPEPYGVALALDPPGIGHLGGVPGPRKTPWSAYPLPAPPSLQRPCVLSARSETAPVARCSRDPHDADRPDVTPVGGVRRTGRPEAIRSRPWLGT